MFTNFVYGLCVAWMQQVFITIIYLLFPALSVEGVFYTWKFPRKYYYNSDKSLSVQGDYLMYVGSKVYLSDIILLHIPSWQNNFSSFSVGTLMLKLTSRNFNVIPKIFQNVMRKTKCKYNEVLQVTLLPF